MDLILHTHHESGRIRNRNGNAIETSGSTKYRMK